MDFIMRTFSLIIYLIPYLIIAAGAIRRIHSEP